jgi:hypothetical protein
MGFFDSANPEQRQENDLRAMIQLLEEIRDLLKKSLEQDRMQAETGITQQL